MIKLKIAIMKMKWYKKCHRYVTMNLIDCKYSWEELSETAVLTGYESQKSRIPDIVMGGTRAT